MNDFWTERLSVTRRLSLRLHICQKDYSGTDDCLERCFLTHDAGKKIYVMGHPLKLGMGQAQQAGNVQAWYYPADGVLVLWECYLYDNFRGPRPPIEDTRHKAIWRAFEGEMIRRFRPAVIVCTSWEETYEGEDWQAFLESEGYTVEGWLAVKEVHLRSEEGTEQ